LTPAAREDDMITIQNILHNNGFPLHHIDKSMAKQKHSKSNPAHGRENDKKWIAFTFFGKETYHISKIFGHTHLRVAFKTKTSLQSLLNTRNKLEIIFRKVGCINRHAKIAAKNIPDKPAAISRKRSKNIFDLSNTIITI
jgi:hypothetical protein